MIDLIMFMKYINVAAALFALTALTGCYMDIDIKSDSEPVLCMNSVITAGKPFRVELSRTREYTDDSSDEYAYLVKDAEVRLYVNGEYRETLAFDERGKKKGYYSEFSPQEGDDVRLVAYSADYGEAVAEVTVPRSARILGVEGNPNVRYLYGLSEKGSFNCAFNLMCIVRIEDTGEGSDYFRISRDVVSPGGGDVHHFTFFEGGMFENSKDPVFSEHMGVLDVILDSGNWMFSVFSDRQFSGGTYPLQLYFRDCFISTINPGDDEELYKVGITFRLSTISESLYKWYIYDWQSYDSFNGMLSDAGLAKTMSGYSNVSTHAGVVGAVSECECYYDMEGIVKKWHDDVGEGIGIEMR